MSESNSTNPDKNQRESQLRDWAVAQLKTLQFSVDSNSSLHVVSGDASFRRYFRIRTDEKNVIVVDAPPEHEDNKSFVEVDRLLASAGVSVPDVLAVDFENGFMLLEDFGDATYLPYLEQLKTSGDNASIDELYQQAIDSIVVIQSKADKGQLDPYDRKELRREMDLFGEWFCSGFLGYSFTESEQELLSNTLRFLEDSALSQATVVVHRDYHSRNLMLLAESPQPGIIDFQDAVAGPYTYDLVSLLRDCYISWPQEAVERWANYYLQAAQTAGIPVPADTGQFRRDLDLMGLQRHLKVMGIFSRLAIRDKKSRYLADIPLVIHYFMEISSRYSELSTFREWFQQSVLPLAKEQLPSN